MNRLSHLDEESWYQLKEMLNKKELKVISLDLPTSHLALSPQITDEFTGTMIKAINSMVMDMHEKIYQLRVVDGLSISDTAKLT